MIQVPYCIVISEFSLTLQGHVSNTGARLAPLLINYRVAFVRLAVVIRYACLHIRSGTTHVYSIPYIYIRGTRTQYLYISRKSTIPSRHRPPVLLHMLLLIIIWIFQGVLRRRSDLPDQDRDFSSTSYQNTEYYGLTNMPHMAIYTLEWSNFSSEGLLWF